MAKRKLPTMQQLQARADLKALRKLVKAAPKPVKTDSRICFSIEWYTSEADAMLAHAVVRKRGDTYNGGWYDGMPCGREKTWDYTDPVLGKLYAVTT